MRWMKCKWAINCACLIWSWSKHENNWNHGENNIRIQTHLENLGKYPEKSKWICRDKCEGHRNSYTDAEMGSTARGTVICKNIRKLKHHRRRMNVWHVGRGISNYFIRLKLNRKILCKTFEIIFLRKHANMTRLSTDTSSLQTGLKISPLQFSPLYMWAPYTEKYLLLLSKLSFDLLSITKCLVEIL